MGGDAVSFPASAHTLGHAEAGARPFAPIPPGVAGDQRATWRRPLEGVAAMPESEPLVDEWLLHVQREMDGHTVVVSVAGEVDHNTVGALHVELDTALALATPPAPVVLDLTGVTFFGSAGLNELVLQHLRAGENRTPLRVVAAHRQVLHPIQLTDLHNLLRLFPDRADALHAVTRCQAG
jgi:anti-anti-sigma factor